MEDIVRISVQGGSGGNGAVHFSMGQVGRADGGSGGDGGSVTFVARSNVRDLARLKGVRAIVAGEGEGGRGNNRSGKKGNSERIDVPTGTVVGLKTEGEALDVWADLVEEGMEVVVASGGEGGRGNGKFVTAANSQPLLAEAGDIGSDNFIELQFKLLVDVAIIGGSNSGKSTLLAAMTGARPKIAKYEFTTINPVLGAMETNNKSVVIVDLPGLIEDSSQGRGLGNGFLRHAERAELLLLVLDGTEEDLISAYELLKQELMTYDKRLSGKEWVVVVNKMDQEGVKDRIYSQQHNLKKAAQSTPIYISACSGEGLTPLLDRLKLLGDRKAGLQHIRPSFGEISRKGVPSREQDREISVLKENGTFFVSCRAAERVTATVDLKNWRARMQLHGELERLGVLRALRKEGVSSGDTVHIGSVELEWQ